MKLDPKDVDVLRRDAEAFAGSWTRHAKVLLEIASHLDMLPEEKPEPEPTFKPGDCVKYAHHFALLLVTGVHDDPHTGRPASDVVSVRSDGSVESDWWHDEYLTLVKAAPTA